MTKVYLPRVFYSLNSECLSNTSVGLMKTLPRGAVTQPRARHIPVCILAHKSPVRYSNQLSESPWASISSPIIRHHSLFLL